MSDKAQEPEVIDLEAVETATEPPVEQASEALPESGPTEEPPLAPVARKRSGGTALVAALLLGAGATALVWYDPFGWRGAGSTQAEVAALTARLDAAEKTEKLLEERLAKLEAAPAVSPETVAALERAVQENQASLGAIKANPTEGGEVSAAQVAALAESVARLEQQVVAGAGVAPLDVTAAVDAALAERETEANATIVAAQQKAARIRAVQDLRTAAQSGAPYVSLLPALDGLPLDPVLTESAATGLTTQAQLVETFPESARGALDVSLRAADAGEGMGDRFYTFLRIQTGSRSLEPQEGSDPDAVLSRAEAAVKAGDIAAALTELAGLPPEGQAEMAGWIAAAQKWQAADKALNELAAAAGVEGG